VFLNPYPLTILLGLLFVCPIMLSVFLLAFHCDIVSIVVTTNEHSIASGRNCPSSTSLDQMVLERKTPPSRKSALTLLKDLCDRGHHGTRGISASLQTFGGSFLLVLAVSGCPLSSFTMRRRV
jgi:hypothetical protein